MLAENREQVMLGFLESTRRFLWLFVELGFLAVLSLILIHLLLGESSGGYVSSVAENVTKFASGMGTPSLIGIGVVLAIIYLLMQRMK
jgi:uncharacterized membrane protein